MFGSTVFGMLLACSVWLSFAFPFRLFPKLEKCNNIKFGDLFRSIVLSVRVCFCNWLHSQMRRTKRNKITCTPWKFFPWKHGGRRKRRHLFGWRFPSACWFVCLLLHWQMKTITQVEQWKCMPLRLSISFTLTFHLSFPHRDEFFYPLGSQLICSFKRQKLAFSLLSRRKRHAMKHASALGGEAINQRRDKQKNNFQDKTNQTREPTRRLHSFSVSRYLLWIGFSSGLTVLLAFHFFHFRNTSFRLSPSFSRVRVQSEQRMKRERSFLNALSFACQFLFQIAAEKNVANTHMYEDKETEKTKRNRTFNFEWLWSTTSLMSNDTPFTQKEEIRTGGGGENEREQTTQQPRDSIEVPNGKR